MTTVNLQGDNKQRAIEKMKKDPMMRALFTKQPEEIVDWWNNTATNTDKDDLMLRVTILVAGLARDIDFT